MPPPTEPEPPPIAAGQRPQRPAAVRQSALGLLAAGAVCVYFGLTLAADAPADATAAERQMWFALDNTFRWCLRGLGALFLVTAALAWSGARAAMLLALAADLGLALLMAAMSVAWTLEARVLGTWDATVLLLIVLGIFALGSAGRSWSLYRAAARAPAAAPGDPRGPA